VTVTRPTKHAIAATATPGQPLRSSGRFVASTTEAIVYSNGRGRLREEADFSVRPFAGGLRMAPGGVEPPHADSKAAGRSAYLQ
jgi:hypothetical protein